MTICILPKYSILLFTQSLKAHSSLLELQASAQKCCLLHFPFLIFFLPCRLSSASFLKLQDSPKDNSLLSQAHCATCTVLHTALCTARLRTTQCNNRIGNAFYGSFLDSVASRFIICGTEADVSTQRFGQDYSTCPEFGTQQTKYKRDVAASALPLELPDIPPSGDKSWAGRPHTSILPFSSSQCSF